MKPGTIADLVTVRHRMKWRGDYKYADVIRGMLKDAGYEIDDGKLGYTISKRSWGYGAKSIHWPYKEFSGEGVLQSSEENK